MLAQEHKFDQVSIKAFSMKKSGAKNCGLIAFLKNGEQRTG